MTKEAKKELRSFIRYIKYQVKHDVTLEAVVDNYFGKNINEIIKPYREKIKDLNAQIKRMKSCVNCSRYLMCNKDANWDKPTEKYCNEWELAE